ncbi:MAG: threonylcarbamoyl-AMP synthase [Fidelibacterota bacterium]|nr:MAG: threonylcarbamoyl-AMP synthase [Candidatus Neomarinimicrobiota bacterium]
MKRIAVTDPAAPAMFWQTIRAGGLVAYPTDTLYGLGVDAENHTAAGDLAEVKGRRGPFSVMVGHLEQLEEYGLVSTEIADKLASMLPGPYTILLQPRYPEKLSSLIIGHKGKVGFRVPRHPFIQAAFHQARGLVITTSVNEAGQPPLQNPETIQLQFKEQIDLLVDGGTLSPSRGSTVVDPTTAPWQVIRQGDGKY